MSADPAAFDPNVDLARIVGYGDAGNEALRACASPVPADGSGR